MIAGLRRRWLRSRLTTAPRDIDLGTWNRMCDHAGWAMIGVAVALGAFMAWGGNLMPPRPAVGVI